MSKIKYFILQNIFPGFYATYANKIIAKNYDVQSNFGVDLSAIPKGQEQDYIEQVKADLKEQHNRKKIIQDKTKSLLFITTAYLIAIIFTFAYLNSFEINVFQTIALVILGVSILCFIMGSIRALQALYTRKYHFIQTKIEITDANYKLTTKKKLTLIF